MGEYITIAKQKVKVGTCENLYYARFEQISRLRYTVKAEEGDTPIRELLDPECGFRFRFPFPDEDNVRLGDFEPYFRGYLVRLPYDHVEKEYLEEVDHDLSMHVYHKETNQNLYVPCMYSCDWTPKRRPETWDIEVVQQKQVNGHLHTVCRCAYCHALFRLEESQAKKLAEFLAPSDVKPYEILTEKELIAQRIMSGYSNNAKETNLESRL